MADYVTLAQDWLGTPYRHQARCKGHGCDCLGLILGIAETAGHQVPAVPAYSMDWSEPQGDERLWQAANAVLQPVDPTQAKRGDILLFRMRRGAVAKHLGVLSYDGTERRFIHAYAGHGVVESRLTKPWQRRVVAAFSFPPLT